MLLFTDGKDTAGLATEAQVKAEADLQTGDQIWVVGLHTADYDADAINSIASSPYSVLEADTPEQLELNFLTFASRVAGQSAQTYYLGYCSPKRTQTHTVAVSVAASTDATTKPAEYGFDATGFGPGAAHRCFRTGVSNGSAAVWRVAAVNVARAVACRRYTSVSTTARH